VVFTVCCVPSTPAASLVCCAALSMKALVLNYTVPALLNIPPPMFKMFIDATIWAIKHTMRDIADLGLSRKFLDAQNSHNRITNRTYSLC
jgi:hypothetical protein